MKKYLLMSSAAIVIGALRVNCVSSHAQIFIFSLLSFQHFLVHEIPDGLGSSLNGGLHLGVPI